MKTFLILFSLFIVANACESAEDQPQDELETQIMMLLYRLPKPVLMVIKDSIKFSGNTSADLDEKCPHSSENFKKAFDSVIECVDATNQSLPVCNALKAQFTTCFTPVINVTENCMPDKSKGVPTLIAKSIMSGISYICGISSEQMFEFFNDCMTHPSSPKAGNIIKELREKINTISDDLSVKNICSTGPEIRNIYKELIGTLCPSQMTQIVYTGLIDALLKPCTVINEA